MDTLGKRLRFIRGNLSQAEFSAKTGINKSTLGRYERDINSPNTEAINAICASCSVRPEWLISGHGQMDLHLETKKLIGLPPEADDSQCVELIAGQEYNIDILSPLREALKESLEMQHIQISERHFAAISCVLYEEFNNQVAWLAKGRGSL